MFSRIPTQIARILVVQLQCSPFASTCSTLHSNRRLISSRSGEDCTCANCWNDESFHDPTAVLNSSPYRLNPDLGRIVQSCCQSTWRNHSWCECKCSGWCFPLGTCRQVLVCRKTMLPSSKLPYRVYYSDLKHKIILFLSSICKEQPTSWGFWPEGYQQNCEQNYGHFHCRSMVKCVMNWPCRHSPA